MTPQARRAGIGAGAAVALVATVAIVKPSGKPTAAPPTAAPTPTSALSDAFLQPALPRPLGPTSCRFMVPDVGKFTADGSPHCDLTFGTAIKGRLCDMRPLTSAPYQWSYDVTDTGAIVLGLHAGAEIAFDCSGAKKTP